MKLAHPIFSEPIVFSEYRVPVLAIENPVCMRKLVSEMMCQLVGEDGNFVLSEDQQILTFKNAVEVVLDPFCLDVNQRRLLNRIYSDFSRLAVGENYYVQGQQLKSEISSFLLELTSESEFAVTFDEDFAWDSLLRAVNLKVDTEGQSLAENIMDYIRAVEIMADIRLLIFVNLQSYFSQPEIKGIEQFAEYEEFNILRIEGGKWDYSLCSENVIIIDEDLCEI